MTKYKIVKGQGKGKVAIKADDAILADDISMDDLLDDSTLDDFDDWTAARVRNFDDAQFDAYLAKIGRKVNRIPYVESRERPSAPYFLSSVARKAADTEERIDSGVKRLMTQEKLNYTDALAKLLATDRELEFEFRQLALHRARLVPSVMM